MLVTVRTGHMHSTLGGGGSGGVRVGGVGGGGGGVLSIMFPSFPHASLCCG